MKQNNKNPEDLINQLCGDLEVVKPRNPYLSISVWLLLSALYITGVVYYSGLQVNFSEKLRDASFIFEMGLAFAILISSALASSFLSFPDSFQ